LLVDLKLVLSLKIYSFRS